MNMIAWLCLISLYSQYSWSDDIRNVWDQTYKWWLMMFCQDLVQYCNIFLFYQQCSIENCEIFLAQVWKSIKHRVHVGVWRNWCLLKVVSKLEWMPAARQVSGGPGWRHWQVARPSCPFINCTDTNNQPSLATLHTIYLYDRKWWLMPRVATLTSCQQSAFTGDSAYN